MYSTSLYFIIPHRCFNVNVFAKRLDQIGQAFKFYFFEKTVTIPIGKPNKTQVAKYSISHGISLIITGSPSIHDIKAENAIIAGIKREAKKKPENINVIKNSANLSDKE